MNRGNESECCGNCEFVEKSKAEINHFECHYNPPTVAIIGLPPQVQIISVHPPVNPNDCCAFFAPSAKLIEKI